MAPVVDGGFSVTEASFDAPEVVAVWSAEQVIVGAAVSVTVMVKVQLPPPLPELMVTTCGEPATEKNEPEAGELVEVPQSPDVSAPKLTIAPGWPPCVVFAETVIFNGHDNTHVGAEDPSARISSLVVAELVSGWGSVVSLATSTSLVKIVFGAPPLTV